VAVLPVPYEGTTCYGAGTRFGPDAIIAASKQIEPYDPRTGRDQAESLGFTTLPPLCPDVSGPERMVAAIAAAAAPLHRAGKFVLGLGGEHTVTVGLVRAAARRWPALCIVQVDAHADLRRSYQGSRFSHACAAARAMEELGAGPAGARLVQVGIRNISGGEDAVRKAAGRRIRTFWAEEVLADSAGAWLAELAALVRGRDVYLSVDVDGLDPAIMPATGTPEPGGLLWQHATALVETVSAAGRLVAADVVELAPVPGLHAPDFLAAKLAYLIACRARLR
jgi:agmatinase